MLKTTVTRSLLASTYLIKRKTRNKIISVFVVVPFWNFQWKTLHSFLISIMYHRSLWTRRTLLRRVEIFFLKVKVFFKYTGKTVSFQKAHFFHQRFPILWQVFEVYLHRNVPSWKKWYQFFKREQYLLDRNKTQTSIFSQIPFWNICVTSFRSYKMRPVFSFDQVVSSMLLQLLVKFEHSTYLWKWLKEFTKAPTKQLFRSTASPAYPKFWLFAIGIWDVKQNTVKVSYCNIRRFRFVSWNKTIKSSYFKNIVIKVFC